MNDQEYELLKSTATTASANMVLIGLLIDSLKKTHPETINELSTQLTKLLADNTDMAQETKALLEGDWLPSISGE
ncbi:hypothetical protein LIN78_11975 [Leeia sp. TBRC 13508]|uniref:Mitotic-spindle organizing protein 1 n=1 Tax=Leeia speluncae TaxID=2884804 RepID=A0ABS8D804_9NEIS|nr:hypothetical protein [Leeia speluncae]MCB6184262.1 hypothetical protein [Leeia speluncae]